MELSEALFVLVSAGIVTADKEVLRQVASQGEGSDDPLADAAWVVWSALDEIGA